MTNKNASVLAATSGPGISYANLFNPLSPIMGGGDKIPGVMVDMMGGNSRAAWLISKLGAVGLLAAGIAGGGRLLQHVNKMSDIASDDDPAKNMKSEIGTTFEGPLSPDAGSGEKRKGVKKKASEGPLLDQVESTASPIRNTVNVGLPLAAMLLAAGAAWKGADYFADKRRNAAMSKAVAGKSNTVRRLMQARARLAKGTISDAEIEDTLASVKADDSYVKTAGDLEYGKAAWSSLGLLVAALAAASGVGAYKYFSASDPDNIRYKAMKKGLREYARSKSLRTPVSIIPTDAESYFSGIDADGAAQGSPREAAEIESARKPISVTL